jgi:hypothetical protein
MKDDRNDNTRGNGDGRSAGLPEDEAPTPDEEREAAALARALEPSGGAEEAAPPDALAAAALLRYAHGGGGLDPSRGRTLAAGLGAELAARVAPTAPPRRWWSRRWLWVAGPLAGAAAMASVLVVGTARYRAASAPERATPPAPSVALLEAQAAAARGDARAWAALDREMRAYRRDLFAQLAGAREGRREGSRR